MGKFSLAEAMKLDVSNLDTETKIEQIALGLIDPNPENFFTVEDDITDLAESIALNGLQQPLSVTPAGNGRYRVIAGHRRRKALLQLAESDPEKWRTAPCIVRHPATPEMEMLMLIQTNTESRELNWSERTKAADKVTEILVKMQKDQGIELPGKMRERVAKIIKTSESQLARAQFIEKHLIPAAKKMGRSDDVCYKLAHLPKEDQEALCEHYKGQSWKLDGPAIKKYQNNIKAGRDPFHVTPAAVMCYSDETRHKCDHIDFTRSSEQCEGRTCCSTCIKRIDCPDACSTVAKSIAEHKQEQVYLIGQRIHAARIEGGLDVNAVREALDLNWLTIEDIEAGFCSFPVRGITEFCKLSGKSADWLLGLTDEDKPAAMIPDGWNPYPDTKPEAGQLCDVLVTDGIDPGTGKKVCELWAARYTGVVFRSALSGTQTRRREIAWRPLPDPPDGYSFSIIKENG